MKKIYNWGILGAGSIARKFANDLQLLSNAKLYAVGSKSQERANTFAREFSIPNAYGSYEEFVRDPEIDVIYIASRHVGHYPDTQLCLNHGKAVLCEKPIAMNHAQFERLRDLAREKNIFLMEALWTRFTPSFIKAKELIQGGAIGEVKLIESDFSFNPPYDPKGRLFDPELGGGALLDIGIYPLFIALELGGDIHKIEAMASLDEKGVDRMCNMLLEHKSGILSVLTSSIVNHGKVESVIQGTRGLLRLNKWWHTPTSIDVTDLNEKAQHFDFDEPGFGYHYEAKEVMKCLDEGRIESSVHSWAHSDRLIAVMDRVRAMTGIRYPGHLEKV